MIAVPSVVIVSPAVVLPPVVPVLLEMFDPPGVVAPLAAVLSPMVMVWRWCVVGGLAAGGGCPAWLLPCCC